MTDSCNTAIAVCGRMFTFIQKGFATDQMSFKNLETLIKLSDIANKQLERLSRIYGMGTLNNQVNVQMNQNNFNSHGQRIYPDDEFTGDEVVNLVFCNSLEQAEMLRKSHIANNCSDKK